MFMKMEQLFVLNVRLLYRLELWGSQTSTSDIEIARNIDTIKQRRKEKTLLKKLKMPHASSLLLGLPQTQFLGHQLHCCLLNLQSYNLYNCQQQESRDHKWDCSSCLS